MHQFKLVGTVKDAPKMFGKNKDTARFTVIVPDEGSPNYKHYIEVVAFGEQGADAERWLQEGTEVIVEGVIKTGSYMKNDRRIYTTDLVAELVATTSGAIPVGGAYDPLAELAPGPVTVPAEPAPV